MRARWLLAAALLWLGCNAVYFLTAPGRVDIIDGGIRYRTTESLLARGTPDVLDPAVPAFFGRDNKRWTFYPIGTPLMSIPFVLLGQWMGGGATEPKQFAFSLTSIPFAAGAAAVLFLILGRLGCSMRRAAAYALALAFCTPMWVYAGSSFDMAQQAFFLLVAAWAAVEAFALGSERWAVLSGIAFALLINVQETYVVLAGCIAGAPDGVRALLARVRQPITRKIVDPIVAGVVVVLAYNTYKFGNPLATGREVVDHPLVGNPLVGLAGLFVSPAKSILLYCPLYPFALAGLWRLMREDRDRYAILGVCFAIHLALIASLKFWAGEWAWGPRYLVTTLPIVCIGLPFAARSRPAQALLAAAFAASFAVQVLGIAVDHQRYYIERSLRPFFWVDESSMYKDSPLFARPREVAAVYYRGEDLGTVRALMPGPRPLSMTSWIYGPPLDKLPDSRQWMRQYLVFLVPRPWPLWSRILPPELRPGPTEAMIRAGAGVAVVAFAGLWLVLRDPRSRPLV